MLKIITDPVTNKVLLEKDKLVEAVAAFVVPSDNNTLSTPGLLIVLNPIPESTR